MKVLMIFIVLLIEIPGSCAGKWLDNNRLWSYSREFTTLKGITRMAFEMIFLLAVRGRTVRKTPSSPEVPLHIAAPIDLTFTFPDLTALGC